MSAFCWFIFTSSCFVFSFLLLYLLFENISESFGLCVSCVEHITGPPPHPNPYLRIFLSTLILAEQCEISLVLFLVLIRVMTKF